MSVCYIGWVRDGDQVYKKYHLYVACSSQVRLDFASMHAHQQSKLYPEQSIDSHLCRLSYEISSIE